MGKLNKDVMFFRDVAPDDYVYIVKDILTKPVIMKCFVIRIDCLQDNMPTLVIGTLKDTIIKVNVKYDEKSKEISAEGGAILFASFNSLKEYIEGFKAEFDAMANGWLKVSDHIPEHMQRIEVAPSNFNYRERAYFLNGDYIKEGYRKNLNSITDYWKPL